MSEPEAETVTIPEHFREQMTTRERALYQRVQLAVRGDSTHVDVEVALLDQMFDRFFHLMQREMVAHQDVTEARAANDELIQSQQELIALVKGMAKLLGAVSRK